MSAVERLPATPVAGVSERIIPPVQDRPAISIRDLVVGFGESAPVLNGVSLNISQGERVALIGANGAGKSTLLRSLLRLVEPRSGDVSILGQDVTALRGEKLRQFRAGIGFVFQRHNLVPRLSSLSNVIHGALGRRGGVSQRLGRFRLWHQGFAPEALRREAADALSRVNLSEKALAPAATLSGGQSQRVAIARALMQKPRLMLADEPVASLDPRAGDEVMNLFVQLVVAEGLTLVFTSHQMDHVLAYADRVIGLKNGRIVIDGPAHDFSRDELKSFFATRPEAEA